MKLLLVLLISVAVLMPIPGLVLVALVHPTGSGHPSVASFIAVLFVVVISGFGLARRLRRA